MAPGGVGGPSTATRCPYVQIRQLGDEAEQTAAAEVWTGKGGGGGRTGCAAVEEAGARRRRKGGRDADEVGVAASGTREGDKVGGGLLDCFDGLIFRLKT